MAAGIELRVCHSLEDFDECVRLEHVTWGEHIVVPSAMLVVAEHTGGQTVAAFDGEKMVGFAYAVAGLRPGQQFLHSHMAAVLPEYQNSGIGRKLKMFQREVALQQGISLIEWTFDPLELKNAHFNLARLGAVARRYLPNCYGITDSPLHAGMPTDRLIAEWWLSAPRTQAILEDKPVSSGAHAIRISVPSGLAATRASNPDAGLRIQSGVREKFQQWLERGFVATGIESLGETASYILEPGYAISGLQLPESHKD
jgi:predicted GNAT superfamily acetyltransferase